MEIDSALHYDVTKDKKVVLGGSHMSNFGKTINTLLLALASNYYNPTGYNNFACESTSSWDSFSKYLSPFHPSRLFL